MNSIKKKLFFQIGSLIIILVIMVFLANTFLLNDYYINREKKHLFDYYQKINSSSSIDYEDLLKDFIYIENRSNIDILIYTPDGDIHYASKTYVTDKKLEKLLKPLIPGKNQKPPRPPIEIRRKEHVSDKIEYIWAIDLITNTESLILTGQLDNGHYFDLRLPLISIATSIDLANQFLLFTGIPLFIIGIISAYFLSKSFTKPILQMNDATNQLKALNFSTKCEVKSNDEIGQLANSINDMSVELAETIESLNTSNQNLQKEIEEKIKIDEKRKQLLNNVSHELKTPLALMQGYAEGLKLNVAKNSNRKDFYCNVIVDEAKKMNELVQDLLDINQIESGDISLNKTTFDIVEFVEHVIKKYHPQFEKNSINLSYQSQEPINVYADSLKVEQVLTNYLNNAIQYVDKNRHVTVSILDKENHVRIETYNSCEAIEEGELDKLWVSFYKIDKSRTRIPNGSHGLGLSIVRAIQEADNNNYGVRMENQGITFWFEVDKI